MTIYFCTGCLKDFEGDVFTAYDRPTGRVLCASCRRQKQESPDLSKIKLKGGWSMFRERFSEAAIKIFHEDINRRREIVRLPDDAMEGSRFNDDGDILARLESRFTEEEFMACPGPSIDAALIDAAQSDYWYKFEKDYEWPDTPETEIDDE